MPDRVGGRRDDLIYCDVPRSCGFVHIIIYGATTGKVGKSVWFWTVTVVRGKQLVWRSEDVQGGVETYFIEAKGSALEAF